MDYELPRRVRKCTHPLTNVYTLARAPTVLSLSGFVSTSALLYEPIRSQTYHAKEFTAGCRDTSRCGSKPTCLPSVLSSRCLHRTLISSILAAIRGSQEDLAFENAINTLDEE